MATVAMILNGLGVSNRRRPPWLLTPLLQYCSGSLSFRIEQISCAARIVLLGLSPQVPDGSITMQEKHRLYFAALSDPGNHIDGALDHPSDAALETQRAHGLDLTRVNADGTTTLPIPTVATVGRDGKFAWIDVHADYSTRTKPQHILDALDLLGF